MGRGEPGVRRKTGNTGRTRGHRSRSWSFIPVLDLIRTFVVSNGQDGGRSGLGPPTGGAALPARLRSFPAVYLSLALSSLLLLGLSALALARVSSISSKLHQESPEWNFSSWDSFLFPCGADSREWEYFSGNCYYFSLARLSWERAREQCRERRARLAVVGSFAEQQFLMSRTRNERFWIGLTDRNSEGNWEWVDGTDYKSSFTFWREGEPNDSGSNEDCAHLWISGKWNDVHCTFECFFVCERPLSQKSPFSH
ncbi:hepatic lectin-like [Passer domesticus]|uniref:hepatic lectin-like n=1 Tax=Passer domesticus TaxID=48849 RepID=UPI0030FEB2D8